MGPMALDFVRVTEKAAIAAAQWVGRGDKEAADRAAVDAMRSALETIPFRGTVAIGEGERDKAPMLYIGEKVGSGEGPELDLALDPLEGTTLCSKGGANALAVMAIAEKGNFLNAPDTYMQKMAVGPWGRGHTHLEKSPRENLEALALNKGCDLQDLGVVVLDRPRHKEIIDEVRRAKARVYLIGDGDVAASLACCDPHSGMDLLLGIGGAPEGVLAAAALKALGGDFQGCLKFQEEEQKERAKKMGLADPEGHLSREDLARGPVLFVATGVTPGPLLKGVQVGPRETLTESLLISSKGPIRKIHTRHPSQ